MPDSTPWSIVDALCNGSGTADILIEAGAHGPSQSLTHGQLLEYGIQAARTFRDLGVTPGDRIVTFLPTGRALLQSIIGAWCCGASIAVVDEHWLSSGDSRSLASLKRIMDLLDPRIILVAATAATELDPRKAAPDARLLTDTDLPISSLDGGGMPSQPTGDEIAVIQFSSGTSGDVRGAIIRHHQICQNLRGIAQKAEFDQQDRVVSWLPLHHDMGLFGGTLYPLLHGMSVALLPTERFANSPPLWLKTISDFRGTLSPAPTFAYRLLTRIARARQLAEVDLSCWRYAWVGSEPVFERHIQDFNSAFADRGLAPTTLQACYGLGETVVAVSCRQCGSLLQTTWVDAEALRRSNEILIRNPHELGAIAYVGCGTPNLGTEVKIADDHGNSLGEAMNGRIMVKGECVSEGYVGQEQSRTPVDWLDTGDRGFLLSGELFITGRTKNIIIRGGVNYPAEDLERAAENLFDKLQGRVAAFSCIRPEQSREEIVVVAETRAPENEIAGIREGIRTRILNDVRLRVDRVELVPPGTIPRTSSGKIQRQIMRDLYLSNDLRCWS